jgi:hypothetical protein
MQNKSKIIHPFHRQVMPGLQRRSTILFHGRNDLLTAKSSISQIRPEKCLSPDRYGTFQMKLKYIPAIAQQMSSGSRILYECSHLFRFPFRAEDTFFPYYTQSGIIYKSPRKKRK